MIEKLNKNKITADWLNLFSDFSKYKIMHIHYCPVKAGKSVFEIVET